MRLRRSYEEINGALIEKRFDRVAEEIANMLRKSRERVFDTQGDFTLFTGIPQSSVSRWERGGRLPMLRTLLIVAEATSSKLTLTMEPQRGAPLVVIFDPRAVTEARRSEIDHRKSEMVRSIYRHLRTR